MYINKIVTTPAPFHYSSSQILDLLASHYQTAEAKHFVASRIRNSAIASRNFALPLEAILKLTGLDERARHFSEIVPGFFKQLLAQFGQGIVPDVLITTSCTVPTLPSLDLGLIQQLSLSTPPLRVPVYQHGCLGGVWSLSLASRLRVPQVLVCSFEVCSLIFQAESEDPTQIMGAVLFADGASAAIVSETPDSALLKILGSADYIIPETSAILGYTILESSTQLVLSPQVPALLREHFPTFIDTFLMQHNLTRDDIAQYLTHPGGVKILDSLCAALKVEKEMMQSSYEILSTYGNMSSTSIFFVLEHYLQKRHAKSGDKVLILGVGPGINLELVLCQIP